MNATRGAIVLVVEPLNAVYSEITRVQMIIGVNVTEKWRERAMKNGRDNSNNSSICFNKLLRVKSGRLF